MGRRQRKRKRIKGREKEREKASKGGYTSFKGEVEVVDT